MIIETPDPAEPFRRVAQKIDNNREAGFGGAFVIVAPDGHVHDLLLLDNAANAAIFWSLVKTRAEIAISEIEDAARGSQAGFGRR